MSRMLQGMLCTDFIEWQNFSMLEPFGARADEIHMAGIRAQIANYLKKSGTQALSITDFMLTAQQKTPKKQTAADIYKLMKGSI